MPEESTQAETATTQDGGTGADAGSEQAGATGTAVLDAAIPTEPVDVSAELESLRAALRKANAESAERRHKLQEYEDAERQRQEAELTETEKLKKRLAEVEADRQRVIDEVLGTRIRHAVEMTAAQMRFHDPADAYALADLSAATVTDDGRVDGVEDALKALAKSKPHLVKGAEQQPANLNAQSRTNGAAGLSDEEAQRIGAIYGVRPEFIKKVR